MAYDVIPIIIQGVSMLNPDKKPSRHNYNYSTCDEDSFELFRITGKPKCLQRCTEKTSVKLKFHFPIFRQLVSFYIHESEVLFT